VNVVPLARADASDRPAEVFTWGRGVWVFEGGEEAAVRAQIARVRRAEPRAARRAGAASLASRWHMTCARSRPS
jgi:hypothetical protein